MVDSESHTSLVDSVVCFDYDFFLIILKKKNVGQDEREIQKNYWVEHSADLTVEAMMLDSKASDLDKAERPEVSSY